MKTNEELVLIEKQEGKKLKGIFKEELRKFIPKSDAQKRKSFDNLYSTATDYFNHLDDFVTTSGLLGKRRNKEWIQKIAEDCHSVLESVFEFYSLIGYFSNEDPKFKELSSHYVPSTTAFASMQKLVKKYCPEIVEDLENKFTSINLPTYGFRASTKGISMKSVLKIGFSGFAVAIILLILNYFNIPPKNDNDDSLQVSVIEKNNVEVETAQNSNISNTVNSPTTINNYYNPIDSNAAEDRQSTAPTKESISDIDQDIRNFNNNYGTLDMTQRGNWELGKDEYYAKIDEAYKELCRIYSKVVAYNLKAAYSDFFRSADIEFYNRKY